MKNAFILSLLAGTILLCAVPLVFLGCEPIEESTETIKLTIDPSILVLTNEGDTVVFEIDTSTAGTSTSGTGTGTAAGSQTNRVPFYLPFEWRVSDRSLGAIEATADFQAVYTSTGRAGLNIIRVEDQGGKTGLAVINQLEP